MSATTLYVGNLPVLLGVQALRDRFAAIGKVISVKLSVGQTRSRGGFAYVEMSTIAEAQRAIEHLNMTELDGRVISVTKFRALDVSMEIGGIK